MTTLREAAQQALEALEHLAGFACDHSRGICVCEYRDAADALRAALAQEQAEPVVRGAAYVDALRWTIKACGAVQRHDGVWFGDDAAARLARVLSEGIAPPQQAEPVEPVAWANIDSDRLRVDPATGNVSIGAQQAEPTPPDATAGLVDDLCLLHMGWKADAEGDLYRAAWGRVIARAKQLKAQVGKGEEK